MTTGELRAYRRLALTVIYRAVLDVHLPEQAHSAHLFLEEGAPGWAEIAGVSRRAIVKMYREFVNRRSQYHERAGNL